MKTLVTFILSTLISSTAMAGSDAIAIFHQPKEVTVLVTEAGESSRLQKMMDAFGKEEFFLAETADKSIRIECNRFSAGGACSFRFLPAEGIQIKGKTLKGPHTSFKSRPGE